MASFFDKQRVVRALLEQPSPRPARIRTSPSYVSSPLLLVGVATLSGIAIAAIRRRRHFSQEALVDA